MEPKEIEALLKEWATSVRAVDSALDQMIAVFGGSYDCDNANAIFDLSVRYTKLVAEKVGDNGDWLNYFWHDCCLGETPRKVTFCDGPSILLDSVDALIETILAQ